MTTTRHLFVLVLTLFSFSYLSCAQVVYPAAQTRKKHTDLLKKPSRRTTLRKPSWAQVPEDVVIRGENDPSPFGQLRLPKEDMSIIAPQKEEIIDEAALFGPSRQHDMPPPPQPAEESDGMLDLSFNDPDEMLSSLGEVFQLDDDALNEIRNFDFSALADMDFPEEDEFFAAGSSGDESSSGKPSFDSFNQFGDFSSLFAQE